MTKMESVRMQNLGDDFSRLHQPRARPVKKMMTVDHVNSLLPDRAQIRPRRVFSQQIQIRDGLRDLESAGQEKNYFRIRLDQARPIQPWRMFAAPGEKT